MVKLSSHAAGWVSLFHMTDNSELPNKSYIQPPAIDGIVSHPAKNSKNFFKYLSLERSF